MTESKFDITDYKKITNKLLKIEDGGVYVFKIPIGVFAEELVRSWASIPDEEKPKAKIMLLPHNTEIWKRK